MKGQGFLRSSIGKSADVEKQHHRFLSQVIGEFDFLRCGAREGKVRRFVAHLERQALTSTQRARTTRTTATAGSSIDLAA